MDKKSKATFLYIAALILFAMSAFFCYKGYDKMTNYYNSEKYPSLNKNAYVGGDAYNYIINGNYATGFFVLSAGSLISGTILVGTALLLGNSPEPAATETKQEPLPENPKEEEKKD